MLKALRNLERGDIKNAIGKFKEVQKELESLDKFPFHEKITELSKEGYNLSLEFVKNDLIIKIIKCIILLSRYALKKNFKRVDEIYLTCIRKIKSSRFNADERVGEYVSLLKDLQKEIITIHFNFAEFQGYQLFEQQKFKNAIKYFKIAKDLVRKVGFRDNKSRINNFKNLINECKGER